MATTRVAICDYGVGNLRSVERALLHAGAEVVLTGDAGEMRSCAGVVLPGVGAFGAAVEALESTGLGDVVKQIAQSGTPLLGVCLGHQLLFEESDENGGRRGLGLLPGRVVRLGTDRGKVPHMGWNQLRLTRESPLFDGVEDGSYAYFVHSYAATDRTTDTDAVVATVDYGGPVVAACARDNVWSTQFHPEKSGSAGLRLYANFVRVCSTGGRLSFGRTPAANDGLEGLPLRRASARGQMPA